MNKNLNKRMRNKLMNEDSLETIVRIEIIVNLRLGLLILEK